MEAWKSWTGGVAYAIRSRRPRRKTCWRRCGRRRAFVIGLQHRRDSVELWRGAMCVKAGGCRWEYQRRRRRESDFAVAFLSTSGRVMMVVRKQKQQRLVFLISKSFTRAARRPCLAPWQARGIQTPLRKTRPRCGATTRTDGDHFDPCPSSPFAQPLASTSSLGWWRRDDAAIAAAERRLSWCSCATRMKKSASGKGDEEARSRGDRRLRRMALLIAATSWAVRLRCPLFRMTVVPVAVIAVMLELGRHERASQRLAAPAGTEIGHRVEVLAREPTSKQIALKTC